MSELSSKAISLDSLASHQVLPKFQDPPFRARSLFEVARGIVFSALLFTFLLLINVAQTLSLVIRPFSKQSFRKINRFFANTWWGACVLAGRTFNGIQLHLAGDPIPYRENAIVIANHQNFTDIYVLMTFALTKGRLGDLKYFVKDIIKYIPGVGWGTCFLDCLFVKRNWEADKSKIEAVFSNYRRDKIPAWFVTFAEGTRLTQEKLIRSQTYARENGYPVLKNVLLPRTKGFVATMQGISQEVQAVYDFTIGFPKGVFNLWQVLKGTAIDLHLHVRRFEIQTLPSPNDNAALSKWLVDRFVEKDQLLEKLKQNGKFLTPQEVA